jgi:hypothetical protein
MCMWLGWTPVASWLPAHAGATACLEWTRMCSVFTHDIFILLAKRSRVLSGRKYDMGCTTLQRKSMIPPDRSVRQAAEEAVQNPAPFLSECLATDPQDELPGPAHEKLGPHGATRHDHDTTEASTPGTNHQDANVKVSNCGDT